jgi:type I site-specific restriction endonuclease
VSRDHITLETILTPAAVEPSGTKGCRRKGPGRTDYLLCVQLGDMPEPLPVAVLEAKKENEDPLKGMQQAKRYADCERFDVQYVFSTNGHLYGEFEKILLDRQACKPARVPLTLAKGAGKTIIVTNLLWRLSQAGQLPKPALFLCDRDELREQAYNKLKAAFGDNARIVKTEHGGNAAANARVHIATYQTLGLDEDDADGFASFLTEH